MKVELSKYNLLNESFFSLAALDFLRLFLLVLFALIIAQVYRHTEEAAVERVVAD